MDASLKSLITERAMIKGTLTRLVTFVDKSMSSSSIDALQKRLDMHTDLFDKFNSVQFRIETLVQNSELEKAQPIERDNFESMYFETIGALSKHIKNSLPMPVSSTSSVASSSVATQARPAPLPAIVLPTFDGQYDKWMRFRDIYESLVNSNNSLSAIEKYRYLESALTGDAARSIAALGFSQANYADAWAKIKEKYENPKALVRHHLELLVELPNVTKESHTVLKRFIDDAANHLQSLDKLGLPTDKWGAIVTHILAKKLNSKSRDEWAQHMTDIEGAAEFDDLSKFINKRCSYLESKAWLNPSSTVKSHSPPQNQSKPERFTSYVANSMSAQCPLCKTNHALYHCEIFKGLPHPKKIERIKEIRACFNCLNTGHSVQKCTKGACRKCGYKHHTLIHLDSQSVSPISIDPTQPSKSGANDPGKSNPQVYSANITQEYSHTILSTAIVYVKDRQGKFHECRAMLDSGSQVHLLTKQFCERVRLPCTRANVTVGGLGGNLSKVKSMTKIEISSKNRGYRTSIPCWVMEHLADDMPKIPLEKYAIQVPPGITPADPHFSQSRKIDMILGADIFYDLLCVGQIKVGNGNLTWQKTKLGWVLAGRISFPVTERNLHTYHIVSNETLEKQLESFWTIEDCSTDKSVQIDKTDPCEKHFLDTTTRDEDGHFVVSIPFNDNIQKLGESRDQAEKRLLSMERKLSRQPFLHREYHAFMAEYESLGHMTRIPDDQVDNRPAYYLPHHAVIKEGSTTTKVRVVFDGSAKTNTGISLNDAQRIGPTVQDDLFSILVRFRKHQFVLAADIEKMYRQVQVKPSERRFQRILWRSNPQQSIQSYDLNTVTYGTASAPFLATRVLRYIGENTVTEFPVAGRAIMKDFYVDDLLTGAESIREARKLRREISEILVKSGFSLRKWASNDMSILIDTEQSREIVQIDLNKDPKTLGLLWSPEQDKLHFSIKPAESRVTKRTILSEIAQVFDPLGLIGPVLTKAKLVMQQLWQSQVGWDESVSQDIHSQWKSLRESLNSLPQMSIPRCVLFSKPINIEIHGFSDASEKAYGACVYLRSAYQDGTVLVRLLCAKSRVAPLKTVTLPRLELCGALLLAQLTHKVKSSIELTISEYYYWSDSTIALAWIRASPTKWKTYVSHRVATIQNLTDSEQWNHVCSEDNPADVISRGMNPAALSSTTIWWTGPSWLTRQRDHWPLKSQMQVESDNLPERKVTCYAVSATVSKNLVLIERFSSWTRLLRVTAFCLRFIQCLKQRVASRKMVGSTQNTTNVVQSPDFGFLTAAELLRAETSIIKFVQGQSFANEVLSLQKGNPIKHSSPLLPLNPFLDDMGLIRVGGRLEYANLKFDNKHPVILPGKHPLTALIVNHEHRRLLHAGATSTIASIRARFWPLACRRVVKGIIRRCIQCFRAKPSGISYLMGNLPAARLTPSRPFSTCGVDYAGPFMVKDRTRSKVSSKAYLCIFVCFVTKAIHMELATDLSTETFLNCFRRFIARRGRCRRIYSDNGTNFVGARNVLNELGSLISNTKHNRKITEYLAAEQIEWNLIPPRSPHFGGLWEGAVKSAKHHLRRVVGEQRLTFEELYTLLTQIESCLNSRPLCPLSADPDDLNPLTPGHFLIGDMMTATPHPDLQHIPQNRCNRFQLVQQMFQHFWKRWQREYLHELQQRNKWQTQSPKQIERGAMVLVKEDNLPPMQWRLGRIIETHAGADSIIRVVSVKTKDGVLQRPITKVFPLPIDEKQDAELQTEVTASEERSDNHS